MDNKHEHDQDKYHRTEDLDNIEYWPDYSTQEVYDSRASLVPANPQFIEDFDALTPIQVKFVRHYARGENGKQAAISAGSKAKRPEQVASKWVSDPYIKAAVQFVRSEAARGQGLDTEEVIRMARDVYRTAMVKGNLQQANKAIDTLSNIGGFFKKPLTTEEELRSRKRISSEGVASDLIENWNRLKAQLPGSIPVADAIPSNLTKIIDVTAEEVKEEEDIIPDFVLHQELISSSNTDIQQQDIEATTSIVSAKEY